MESSQHLEARLRQLEERLRKAELELNQRRYRREPEWELSGFAFHVGVLRVTLAAQGSSTANRIILDENDEPVYTGDVDTIWDALENLTESVEAGIKVVYAQIGRHKIVIQVMCEVSDTLPVGEPPP